jgi:hypothetical protein
MPSADPTSQPTIAAPATAQQQVLAGGEVILLALKPSPWFMLIASLPVLISAGVVAALAYVAGTYCGVNCDRLAYAFAVVVTVMRVTVASWQWLGQTYLLTNLRVLNIRGLMKVQTAFVPLLEIGRVELTESLPERVVGVGTLSFLGGEHPMPRLIWQSISQPAKTQKAVEEAIDRARRVQNMNAGK